MQMMGQSFLVTSLHAHLYYLHVVCITKKRLKEQSLKIVQTSKLGYKVDMFHCQLAGKFKSRLLSPFLTPAWHSDIVIPNFLFQGITIEEHVRHVMSLFPDKISALFGQINGNTVIVGAKGPLQQVLTIHRQ